MNKRFLFIFLPFGLLILAIFVPHEGLKEKWADLMSPRRVLIEKVDYSTPSGSHLVFIKVKEKNGLYLEVFSSEKQGQEVVLLQRQKLLENLDAQVQINQQNRSLFVFPLGEKQKQLKILAPTLDRNLRPYLNAYTWSLDSNTLETLTE